ncbi:2-hydroxyacid dehydrogenase [Marinibacterium sp. SX1]|uniref:2-hydroxyacid dehydrogenase n=1 Tax=Marinibacterium sp. SX1 TaxID=3388424 RepID=UPI003D1645FC
MTETTTPGRPAPDSGPAPSPDLADTTAPILVVALSEPFDLVANFKEDQDPRVTLVRPDEVEDPGAVTCAIAWRPAADAFDPYPNIKMVSSIAAGVDSIMDCPSLPSGVTVTRIRDEEQARMMAGFAAWHVLHHHRRMGDYLDNQKAARWDRSYRAPMASEVTVGLLGFGLMGQHTARALVAMGYRVLAASRSGNAALDGVEILSGPGAVAAVAARADYLVNLLPLTDETRDILDAALFATMPAGAVLIQLGRGEHLVEPDLLAALDRGHLAAASLDVFRDEPLPADSPFWAHPRVVVTPHKASDTTRSEILRQVAENYAALIAGETPPGAVDRDAGY